MFQSHGAGNHVTNAIRDCLHFPVMFACLSVSNVTILSIANIAHSPIFEYKEYISYACHFPFTPTPNNLTTETEQQHIDCFRIVSFL